MADRVNRANGDPLDIRAAGGVLWRPAADSAFPAGPMGPAGQVLPGGAGMELAIVHRPRYDDWSLPKGKLHDGEHPLLAACREVHEETGIRPVAGRRLPEQEYWLGPDRKTVDYWVMSGADPAGTEFVSNAEVDKLRWVRPGEAVTWLSYDRDRELVRSFLAVPPATATLLLVRHGHAGERSSWPGEDRRRPLDDAGRAQAETLRATLRCFGPQRVLSADNVRCVDTVAPLAADLGVPVDVEPALTEEAYTADRRRGLRRIRMVASAGGRSVLCSQGAVIPDVVATLASADGLRLDLPAGTPARKGSVWVLSFVDDRLAAADYYADLDRR